MTNKEKLQSLNNDDFNGELIKIAFGCDFCPNRNKETDTFKNSCNCAKEFFKWLEMQVKEGERND